MVGRHSRAPSSNGSNHEKVAERGEKGNGGLAIPTFSGPVRAREIASRRFRGRSTRRGRARPRFAIPAHRVTACRHGLIRQNLDDAPGHIAHGEPHARRARGPRRTSPSGNALASIPSPTPTARSAIARGSRTTPQRELAARSASASNWPSQRIFPHPITCRAIDGQRCATSRFRHSCVPVVGHHRARCGPGSVARRPSPAM
jgi:hypothetical protein